MEETDTPFTRAIKKGQLLKIPVKHGEGCYYADAVTLERLRRNRQILLRYVDAKGKPSPAANPNGSLENIAGICNERRNVFGLMPHPEDACNKILGGEDGLKIFSSDRRGLGSRRARMGEERESRSLQPAVTPSWWPRMALRADEYEKIVKLSAARRTTPSSESFRSCGRSTAATKARAIILKRLPTEGPQVLKGRERTPASSISATGSAVAFKMESHNHPSFIEPYQGAATGVGGILRDIFTMGARPIASLNSLRFGAIDHPRTGYLLAGVVAGIGGYGNCIGVPTVGGECYFDECYNANILVNAFTLGITTKKRIFTGVAKGIGNPVMYVGSKTGRDGIHGATMASESFSEEKEQRRPTVQVGDPFTEKLLLEACLELMEQDYIVGIQDMGAAGLTSSSSEMAGRGGVGIELDLSACRCAKPA